jgi:hypothetical protein
MAFVNVPYQLYKTTFMKKIFLLLVFLTLYQQLTQAQNKATNAPDSLQVYIEMKDGSFLQGKLISKQNDSIVIESASVGRLKLAIANMKNISDKPIVEPAIISYPDPQFGFRSPHANRSFALPTAFGIDKGEWYYSNQMIVSHQLAYGFSDNFSMGMGTVIVPGAGVAFYVNPKISFKITEGVRVGSTVILGLVPGEGVGGLIQGFITFGNRNHNVTLGRLQTFVGGEDFSGSLNLINTQVRLSPRFGLLAEAYLSDNSGSGQIFSIAGRYFTNRFSLNLGIFISSEDTEQPPVLPLVGVGIPFSRKKEKRNSRN